MLLNASVSILISLDKPFQEFAKECQSATAVLYPYSVKDEEVISLGHQFAELSEVEKVEYTRFYNITEELVFNEKKIEAFTKLTEYSDAVYGKIRYLKGDKNVSASLNENECVIPACISNKYNIKTGDSIKLKLTSEEVIYTVKGIYSEAYNTSTAFDSDILVKKLPKSVSGKLHIKLYGMTGIEGREIEEAYREKYNGQLNGAMYTLEDRIDNGLLAGNIVGGVFLAIGIIMLIVSCIIINFMIKNVMITDAKTIAVYKTMGYSSNDILKLYLTFYFVVVSAACVIGIGNSVFLSNIILSSVFKNMGQVVESNAIIPGILCYLLIVGFVLGVIFRIIGNTKKVKPVYALNGMSSSSTKKKKDYKGNSKMQFSALGIALRTINRSKKGAISILITSIVTVFSINFAVISLDIANTMKENNDYWLGVDKSDVMIGVTDRNQYEKVEMVIREDPSVDYYFNSNLDNRVTMKWKKGMNTTNMSAFVYDDYSQAQLPIIKGRNPEAGNEIAISSKVSSGLDKAVGDYIEIFLGGQKRVNLMITGIFQTYYQIGDACRLTTDVYIENNYDFQYNNFSIYLKDKETIDGFMKDIKMKIGASGNVYPRTEAFSSIMDDMIVNPQKRAIPPVVVLVLLIGGINIFCIVLLKNATSEKTNGIYKCLGYSTWHLIFSNLYYVGIVAVASIAIAVPMIIILYPSIMKLSLSMFGFLKYPVSYNYWHIALANIAVFMTFIISTLISSRSLKKVSVRDLVQE
jgi:putative ABC transport system permease protein